MTRHMVIPDTQVKPNTPLDHFSWAGEYAVEMRPDVIVHIGDHWDMESLSSYDKGKGTMEGKRYLKDIQAGNLAMDMFMEPIAKLQASQRRNKKKVWEPRLIFTLGNHENRIDRVVEEDAWLEAQITTDDFCLEDWGWEVHPFLSPVVVDGVAYCHYFTSGVMGRPCASARLMLNKKHMSTVMGHVQDRDIAWARRADGKQMTGLFAGIFYQHNEAYLNTQTNQSWRGIWIFNEVEDGSFDELPVSLRYLEKRYG
jgi:hypothetical protein